MLNINDTLKKLHLKNNDPLIIGCSAGPDSMALLHYLKKTLPNPIIVAHINHNKRKESQEEEEYLQNYCQQNNLIFEKKSITEYKEANFENEARTKRYQFYKKIINKYQAHYLFLAHHGDDLIETILMKIDRGSNLEGYAGMKEISKKDSYYIIRPFLKYTKQDLITYNQEHHIKYYLDKTNDDITYTRNRYRKKILPLLKEENQNIHTQFLKFSKTIEEYLDYLENELTKQLPTIYQQNILNLDKFKQLDPFIQKQLLYKILYQVYHNQPNIIKQEHIFNLIKIINSKTPNLTYDLPKNKMATKTYNKLLISTKQKKEIKNYKLPLENINKINNIIIKKIDNTKEDGNNICRLNSKELELPLFLRNRKPGDTIEQKGLNGHKKVKEIFIENKIPKSVRDYYPILVDNKDQIIWIPNLKKSKFNSQTHEFYDIILGYCEKEENNEQQNS